MRPLDKGDVPVGADGNPIAVTDYTQWRNQLIDRIGYYCVYCNMPLSHSLQVEHVVPKNPPPGFTAGDPIAWDNMLLACGPCNNAKSNKPVDFVMYYFPEEHNTLLPFEIREEATGKAAFVNPATGINVTQEAKAQRTIALTGLDKIDNRKNIVDIRWKRRRDALKGVAAMFKYYEQAEHSPTFNAKEAAEGVVEIAKNVGFFGIWFEYFEDKPDVMQELISGLPGTATFCFDAANGYRPIARNAGNLADPF